MPPSSPARTLVLVLLIVLPSVRSIAAPASPASPAEEANLANFRDLTETRNYPFGRPVSPKLTPDGKHARFLRSRARVMAPLLYPQRRRLRPARSRRARPRSSGAPSF